ncbi:isatin hydrolase-like [Pollicipes pollicipes]|uniref:isatin hydrolase-like n=1 Tax=Pollicipes pollicipes TaxID=41117 RepID=UPI001884D0A7|nr:isatin hydrolase-like [Pollicipes pollicipes]
MSLVILMSSACQAGLLLGFFLLLVLLCPASAGPWIDLSHTYDKATQYWPGLLKFNLSEVFKGQLDGYWLEMHNFETAEHGGTHMDAPAHFFRGAWTLEQIPIDRFVAHAALVNISARSDADPDTTLTPADLIAWKEAHGNWRYPIVLLVYTGYANHWGNSTRYWGVTPEKFKTQKAVNGHDLHFPGIGAAAAEMIAADDAIVGVGIDTALLDPGTTKMFPAHTALFRRNIFGLENLADMSRVPATGATIMALPMKIGGGSGGPCRVLVRLP